MPAKHAVVFDNPRAGNHDYGWRKAFAEGLRRRGWRVSLAAEGTPPACDLVVIWGARRRDLVKRAKAQGAEVCVLERGYVKDRFTWSSVSFGGELNGRAEFRGPFDDISRWDSLEIRLTPWAPLEIGQGHALIIGQVPGDQAVKHVDLHAWYRQVADALRKDGHRDIRFRPHPLAGRAHGLGQALGIPTILGDRAIEDDLQGAAVVVTFNSNAGVDAVIAGRRTIALDPGSMVWELSQQLIHGVYPARDAWCSKIAWCQYSRAEMESGFCQEAVGL